MTALEEFISSWHNPMPILQESRGLSVLELSKKGLDATTAKQLLRLSRVYFGPAFAPSKQKEAIDAAQRQRHSIATLREIERFVKKLRDRKNSWRLRLALCHQPANLRTLRAHATQLVAEFNGPDAITNKPQLLVSAIPGSTFSRLLIDAPSHLIRTAVDKLNARTDQQHPALAALALLCGDTSPAEAVKVPVTPAIILSLPDATTLATTLDSADDSADDIVLSLTNGTRMTGKEFIENTLHESGLVMLVDPIRGPVNLYRTSRLPNPKQRLMAKLENPVCPSPGCSVGADYSQVHHITAWKNGGNTNMTDLTSACKFHNGRNDDDRHTPRHGHLKRIRGHIHHVPAFGGPPQLNNHPVARGGAMRIAVPI